MRQPAVARVRTSRFGAPMRGSGAAAERRSTQPMLAPEFVTMLTLGYSTVCTSILSGSC